MVLQKQSAHLSQMPRINYCIVVPVWGDLYIDIFLNVSLPTQLSVNNLPFIGKRGDVVYRIYTRPNDVSKFIVSQTYSRLSECIATEIIPVEQINFNGAHHYEPFNACYRMGMSDANKDNAAVLFLTADQIWADGTLSRVIALGDIGYKAIMISGPRINQETAIQEILKFKSADCSITISPRQAVQMSIDHMHPWDKSLYMDSDNHGRPASFVYWAVGSEGYIMRCLHLHPILVNPKGKFPRFTRTIDGGNFIQKVCPDFNDMYIIQDSDEAMYFSVAPAEQSAEWINLPKIDSRGFAKWARSTGISRHNTFYLQHPINFHTNDISQNWDSIKYHSSTFASNLYNELNNNILLYILCAYSNFKHYILSLLNKNSIFHKWNINRIKSKLTAII